MRANVDAVYQGSKRPSESPTTTTRIHSRMDTIFQWLEIPTIPDTPGIYAWYYMPEITAFDLERTIQEVRSAVASEKRSEALIAIENFLNQFVFSYFMEDPYTAILRGQLKPNYEGELHHRPGLSSALIDRLVDDPDRLYTVKDVLETSAPGFASPLHIGMSERLGVRLMRHCQLIEKYREKTSPSQVTSRTPQSSEYRDQSFARQIANREINPQRLFVMIRQIDADDNRYVDLENILNRIHYPLLGRN